MIPSIYSQLLETRPYVFIAQIYGLVYKINLPAIEPSRLLLYLYKETVSLTISAP